MKMPAPETPNSTTHGRSGVLWAVILLAVTARIALAFYQGNEVAALPGIADQVSYHQLAVRVLEGHGFSFGVNWWPATQAGEPTAHWSYLYVCFMTAVYFLFGPNPVAARLIQAALAGVLQPLLTWRIGRRLFGPKIGMVSAAFSAFYAYFVFYGGALMTEAFYITSILWALDISTAMVFRRTREAGAPGRNSWALLGLAFGVTVLLRQVFLLLVPVILAWLIWKLHSRSRTVSLPQILGRSAIALAVLLACVAPWTLRNYKAFDTFVLLNTNSGFAFFWGNHPIHGKEFIPILPSEVYGELIPKELRGLNEAEMEKALLLRGLDFVREDPWRYVRLTVSRAKEYIRFWPSGDSSAMNNYLRIFSFGLFLPLCVSGLCLSAFSSKNKLDRTSLRPGKSLLLMTGGVYTLIHLMTWTLIRYRLPVDAVFMPFAAVSIVAGYDFLKTRISSKIGPGS